MRGLRPVDPRRPLRDAAASGHERALPLEEVASGTGAGKRSASEQESDCATRPQVALSRDEAAQPQPPTSQPQASAALFMFNREHLETYADRNVQARVRPTQIPTHLCVYVLLAALEKPLFGFQVKLQGTLQINMGSPNLLRNLLLTTFWVPRQSGEYPITLGALCSKSSDLCFA